MQLLNTLYVTLPDSRLLPDAQAIPAAVSEGILLLCDATPIRVDGLEAGESAATGRAMEIGAALMADDLAARRPPPTRTARSPRAWG